MEPPTTATSSTPKVDKSRLNKEFAPFTSTVGPGFWQVIYDKLLDEGVRKTPFGENEPQWGLELHERDLHVIPIWGYYVLPTFYPQPSLFNVDASSFNSQPTVNPNQYACKGNLILVESIQLFQDIDKNRLIERYMSSWKEMEESPKNLTRFIILCYPDLKNYRFTFWFGFPAISSLHLFYEPPLRLKKLPYAQDLVNARKNNSSFIHENGGFFAYDLNEKIIKSLDQVREMAAESFMYCLIDPCGIDKVPGWLIRNYVAYIVRTRNLQSGSQIKIISLRPDRNDPPERSCVFSFIAKFKDDSNWQIDRKVLGWEQSAGKFAPQTIDLKSEKDPETLSKSAVDFNLKLMKWNLFPEFDLDKMHELKICLLGAGTLGCNVARVLMGWGIRNISFIDNGRVSYSNPVRQSLYTYRDGGNLKATAAAKSLEAIFPGVNANGYRLSIPMPGHPPISVEATKRDFAKLEELIRDSDIIFLLTDTRESRWLPTLLGVVHDKLVINAALGFDSYMVMRHGRAGENLGCYFCTDVVVPGNSTIDRTLDQQCTVSRPGLSMIAGGMAVELMASIIHNKPEPEQGNDEAASANHTFSSTSTSTLGSPAHTLRGFLSSGQHISPTFQKFDKCSACSTTVVEKFKKAGVEFVLEVMNNPKALEKAAGLDTLAYDAGDIVELSDDGGSLDEEWIG